MDSDYPPLPSSAAPQSKGVLHNGGSEHGYSSGMCPNNPDQSIDPLPAKPISKNGDMVVAYNDQDGLVSHRWQVSSEDMMRNSPYFRVLLDPHKFSEGRNLMEQKMSRFQLGDQKTTDENTSRVLPSVNLPVDHFTRRLGADAIELFLRILCFNSLTGKKKREFEAELRFLPTSLVARVIEIADVFNSPQAVRDTLKKTGYAFGKGRVVLSRFNSSLLKLSEDRIRQSIFVANFLDEQSVFQVLTHTLITMGSKFWVNGVELPAPDTLRWRYFSGGLEGEPYRSVIVWLNANKSSEELYYRRQCVLNTITDLQAYFLREYGALEELDDPKHTYTNPASVPTTSFRPRQFQCRMAFGNSSACDAFHLGQMTRFFTLRTKTVFLGSSLIDPDFDPEDDSSHDPDAFNSTDRQNSGPPADITAIIASLKTFPDYQIDPSHTGCGVRRRIVPPLDCVEKFVADSRGLLGVFFRHTPSSSSSPSPLASVAWTNRSLPRAKAVDIRSSRIHAIYNTSGPSRLASSQEDEARLLFTAKKRNWEA